MNTYLLLLAIFILSLQSIHAYRIVCYTTNWSQYRNEGGKFLPEDIDPHLCTHIIYSFAKLSNGELAAYEWNDESTPWMKGLYERTTDLKKINPSLKILIAVGGWSMASTDFSNLVTSQSQRRNFVQTSIEFLRKNKFDGLDLDWEYPANREGSRPSDKQLFTTLIQELKAAYEPQGLLLTAAVAAGKSTIDSAYEIANIAKYLDFINIMTYDYHGTWETFTGHNSPMLARTDETGDQKYLNIDYTINYYISNGTPRDKINLGMATYGRSYKLSNPAQTNLGAPASGAGDAGPFTREAGFLAYYEFCNNLNSGWTRQWNNQQQVPYMHKNGQWLGYDDEQSLQFKVNYVKFLKLGGAMFWAMDLDDFGGRFCGKGKYPLIKFVKSNLNGISPETSTAYTSMITQTGTTRTTTRTISNLVQSTTNGSSNNKCPNGDGYYPDKASGCKNYYVCLHTGTQFFTITEFTCPSNLIFDVTISTCNYPSSVTC